GPRQRRDGRRSGRSLSKSLAAADVDQVDAVLGGAALEDDRVADPPLQAENRLLARVEGLRVRHEEIRRDLLAHGRTDVHGAARGEDRIDLEPVELEDLLRGTRDEAG